MANSEPQAARYLPAVLASSRARLHTSLGGHRASRLLTVLQDGEAGKSDCGSDCAPWRSGLGLTVLHGGGGLGLTVLPGGGAGVGLTVLLGGGGGVGLTVLHGGGAGVGLRCSMEEGLGWV